MVTRKVEAVDVVIIGSGAGGLSTAITAKKHGLEVVVVEKEPFFGGCLLYTSDAADE